MAIAKKILAIDDNADILYTLEQICKFQGWTPLLADSYDAAVEILKKNKPDLILVDYHMPGVDGITAVKEIRQMLPETPIIVLTIEETPKVMTRFMEAGADDYALKPIKAIDLIARIRAHLQFSEKSRYYQQHDKGISEVTLSKIEKTMQEIHEFKDADELEEITGVKKKTLYRYLQYMIREKLIEQDLSYGDMGRPRTLYRWNAGKSI